MPESKSLQFRLPIDSRSRITRTPGTTSVCFSVVIVNDKHRKPGLKIKRWG